MATLVTNIFYHRVSNYGFKYLKMISLQMDAEHLNQLLKDIKEENYNGFYWEFWKQCVKKSIEHPVPLGIKWADE